MVINVINFVFIKHFIIITIIIIIVILKFFMIEIIRQFIK